MSRFGQTLRGRPRAALAASDRITPVFPLILAVFRGHAPLGVRLASGLRCPPDREAGGGHHG